MSSFVLNGQPRTGDADSDVPRLWAFRALLRVAATKHGGGVARCGATGQHIRERPFAREVLKA